MSLGDAVNLCYAEALEDWKRHYAPTVPLAELFAGPMKKVEVRLNMSPGGRANVTVRVYGRRALQDEAYYTPMFKDAGLWMIGDRTTTYSD
jgi:hypothetical protein